MRTLRRAVRLRSARWALVVLAVTAFVAVFGGWLAPQDPLQQNPGEILQGPTGAHWLGTDYLGRDVFSRLLEGTGRSIVMAVEAVVVGMLLGIPAGLASVTFGRAFAWISLRFVDALMTLPFMVFVVAVTGIIGNGPTQAMVTLGVLFTPIFYRITRAAALGLSAAQYVEVAELFGASKSWLLRVHIWSKVLPTVAVTAANALGGALLAVSSLSFLGIGVQPPLATWGGMLASDLGYLYQKPWAPLIPSIAIILTVAACNALADAIRDTSGVPDDGPAVPLAQPGPLGVPSPVSQSGPISQSVQPVTLGSSR
jgi:peptide/nickel transport system permease protein